MQIDILHVVHYVHKLLVVGIDSDPTFGEHFYEWSTINEKWFGSSINANIGLKNWSKRC